MSALTLDDILAIEDGEDNDNTSMQRAINSGSAWSFQGSMGRAMMSAIESGICMLGKSGCRDYYGNYIPSRDEVKSGTKGSKAYVANIMGRKYANEIAKV